MIKEWEKHSFWFLSQKQADGEKELLKQIGYQFSWQLRDYQNLLMQFSLLSQVKRGVILLFPL